MNKQSVTPKREYQCTVPVYDKDGLYGEYIHALHQLQVLGDTLEVNICYPSSAGMIEKIEVGIMAVRAADSILIEYDLARDGYSIKQASKFSFATTDEACDPDWQEVAFIQAWAREPEEQ